MEPINGLPLRAGVSSLGIGGTNAHILLEETPERTADQKIRKYELITYSAKTSASLQRYKSKFADFLKRSDDKKLVNIAYTSKTGRTEFNVRDFVVSDTVETGIKNFLAGLPEKGSLKSNALRILFRFSIFRRFLMRMNLCS